MPFMDDVWKTLRRAGVPLGYGTDAVHLGERDELARRVLGVIRSADVSERERVAVVAWLGAWASGWPSSFAATFGEEGGLLLVRARRDVDADRYLKLRRIAKARLATAL